MGFTGVAMWLTVANREMEDFEKEAIELMKTAARTVTREMMDRTPVWSGGTVRNYVWAVGESPGGGEKSPVGGPGERFGRRSGKAPFGLGEEPRRADNEAAAEADMEAVLAGYTQLRNLHCENFSDIWDLVDNGSAPTPDRARNPGGVSVLAVQSTKSKLENFK